MLTTRIRRTPEQIAERDARNAKIDQCIGAGLCYICDQKVDPNDGVHGPTGAHWDCQCPPSAEKPITVVPPAPATAAPSSISMETQPRLAHANGGHLVHIVIPATNTSLCGHKPRNTAHVMRQRGKWMLWKLDAVVPATMKMCEKCEKKALIDYPPLEDQDEAE